MPKRACAVIAATICSGLVSLVVALHDVALGPPSLQQWALAGAMSGMLALGGLRPLVVRVGSQSQYVNLDEGLLIFLLLAVSPGLVVLAFAAAYLVIGTAGRLRWYKSAFNLGLNVLAPGTAAIVFRSLVHTSGSFSWPSVLAALVGTIAFHVVSSGCFAALMASLGIPVKTQLLDSVRFVGLIQVATVGVAIGSAYLLDAYPEALPVALLPLVILRYTVAGFFSARHDRARLEGLFQTTLDANASMGRSQDDVIAGLLESARSLLRCDTAELVTAATEVTGGLSAPVVRNGERLWLCASGRRPVEPFDAADRALLEALAAVGSGALSNATLYQQSRRQQQRLAAITSSLGEGVVALSATGHVTFVNRAAAAMLGWASTGAADDDRTLIDPDAGEQAPAFILELSRTAIESGETTTTYDTPFERRGGGSVDVACTVAPVVENGEPTGAVLVFRDISEEKVLSGKLRHQALHDALTGLPNRRLFLAELSGALERGRESGGRHAVLFCDIDRFKIINDSLGHHAGDLLLVAIAERIRAVLRPGDLLARFGGDEFTILLENVGKVDHATGVAERVLEAMRDPVLLPDGHELVACVSIGIAVSSPAASRDDVLHDADVAMYEAKSSGRIGAYCVFDVDAMGVRSAERIELEVQLRQAIEREELAVYYQPLFSVFDRRIVGVEALVRWNHPQRGLLAPGHFISLAEETGLILALGKQVLEKACTDVRRLSERLGIEFQVGINLSARQFANPRLLEEVEEIVTRSGVDPSRICFEITESLAMHHVDRTSEVLLGLKAFGARVAIDDFGTGHSALGYLAHFPIDVVKIDRSFVDGVETDPVKSAIVTAVLTMASAIGSTTVVEGVETESQLDHLRSLGCGVAQGYLLARPMPAAELEDLVRSNRVRPPVLDGLARASVRQPA